MSSEERMHHADGGGRPHRDRRHPRGRGRRGDIRSALLIVLRDGPAHGYELIQTFAERSDGMWKPSPGSVYPTLQLLEEQGLLTSTESEGKRVYALTDAGRLEAEQRTHAAGSNMPWEREDDRGSGSEMRRSLGFLHLAVKQVGAVGTGEQVERTLDVLNAARKSIYAVLGEG